MLKLKSRLITTHLTRDGIKFTKECLEDCVRQINNSAKVMPFNVNHDSTRQIGFVVPGSAILVQLGDGEYAVDAEVDIYESKEEKLKFFVEIRQQKNKVTLKELNIDCISYEDTNCPTYLLPTPLFELIKEQPTINKDGLLVLDNPKNLLQKGILIQDRFLVNFHNFLRRSFSEPNAYNLRLIDKIREVKVRNPQLEISFLVYQNLISLKSEFKECFEFDYAWGPKIPKDLSALKEGVTQHIASPEDRSMENIEKTDFWWHKDSDSLMALEVEETRDKGRYLLYPKDKTKYFPLRYSHLQYDNSKRKIIHLDGALRIYSEDKFDFRLSTNDISKVSKNDADRIKLFRIDGEVSPKDAFDILSLFFYSNSDVRAYFESCGATDS